MALAGIQAPDSTRLACQARPTSSCSIIPLLPPDASAQDGRRSGGLDGREVFISCLFVDLRASTKLAENRLPYDVLFILNQFFAEMNAAIVETNGHYAQFNGDGLMALYGLDDHMGAEEGARNALKGANAMLRRLDNLNETLKSELSEKLRVGIGIHTGDAIVGVMGPPKGQTTTAIGDTINTAARLEGLTKEHSVPLVISRSTAETASLSLNMQHHTLTVRGRVEPVDFYALSEVPE